MGSEFASPTAKAMGHPTHQLNCVGALVHRHSSIFGLRLPAPPGPGARVRAHRASGGTGPRAGAHGSDAVTNPYI